MTHISNKRLKLLNYLLLVITVLFSLHAHLNIFNWVLFLIGIHYTYTSCLQILGAHPITTDVDKTAHLIWTATLGISLLVSIVCLICTSHSIIQAIILLLLIAVGYEPKTHFDSWSDVWGYIKYWFRDFFDKN